ncbi:MAG TPA: CatA-like O-acetyltransferase, partial [Chitinophagaceae bacterium]|nr:CatA-like O-acetyltransferase [Chitinophagaceae bacterium]
GTFGFSYIDYYEDFDKFNLEAKKEINRVRNSTGLVPSESKENIVHYSSIPWLNFTALSHARRFTFPDSVPKISFGKMTDAEGRKSMPVSVHVHHALMDGYHVGLFVDEFQKQMNQPSH